MENPTPTPQIPQGLFASALRSNPVDTNDLESLDHWMITKSPCGPLRIYATALANAGIHCPYELLVLVHLTHQPTTYFTTPDRFQASVNFVMGVYPELVEFMIENRELTVRTLLHQGRIIIDRLLAENDLDTVMSELLIPELRELTDYNYYIYETACDIFPDDHATAKLSWAWSDKCYQNPGVNPLDIPFFDEEFLASFQWGYPSDELRAYSAFWACDLPRYMIIAALQIIPYDKHNDPDAGEFGDELACIAEHINIHQIDAEAFLSSKLFFDEWAPRIRKGEVDILWLLSHCKKHQ